MFIPATKDASTACSVTKDGLLAIFAGFGAILAALISAIGFLIIRLKSQSKYFLFI